MSKEKINSISTITDGVESITRKSLEKDGITTSIEVKQVENGYIVTVNEYGEDKKGKWFNNDKQYISKTNPLEEEGEADEKKESFKEAVAKALKNLKL